LHNWSEGYKVVGWESIFLWRPYDESIIDIANSAPKIYEINMDFPKKTTDFQK
jgi:hypothetical protein